MAVQRSVFEEVLKDSYGAYYNIIEPELAMEGSSEPLPLAFRADYFSRAEKYWLSKSIPVWGNEKNEFAYIFSAEEFSPELAERCVSFALEDGLPKVKPHKEHQYTNIQVVLLADGLSEDVIRAVRRRSFSKSYKFSLYGYSTLLLAAVDMSAGKAYTNKAGRDLVKYFKKLFALRAD